MEKTQGTYFAKVSTSASGRKKWERIARDRMEAKEKEDVIKAPNFKGKMEITHNLGIAPGATVNENKILW